jgi:hypothetical protein
MLDGETSSISDLSESKSSQEEKPEIIKEFEQFKKREKKNNIM